MTYCGEHTAVKETTDEYTAVTLPCHSWTCPRCADGRKQRLMAEANGGQPDTFMTLTSRRVESLNSEDAAAALSNAWRVLRKRMLREGARDTTKTLGPFGASPKAGWKRNAQPHARRRVHLHANKLPFLAVVEKTVLGWPHLHILLRSKWIDQEWLSAQMADLLDSPIVDIRRIDNAGRSAAYVAKYCTKCAHKFQRTKRYWRSRDYERRDPRKLQKFIRKPGEWELRKAPLHFITRNWIIRGLEVTFDGTGRAKARKPPW